MIYRVRREVLRWPDARGTEEALRLLPTMRTDISLTAPGRKIVIDAKFYKETLQSHHGKPTIRSSHLYQLLAYLRSMSLGGEPYVEGLLLYPRVNRSLDLHFHLHGHRLRVRTVVLSLPWTVISGDLLGLIAENR
jgi:5-methylcytosine-specific restriction enzyme subunit McrC